MEDDGAGLMKAASNDGGLGEWEVTALEEWRSFGGSQRRYGKRFRGASEFGERHRQFLMGVRGRG